MIKYFYIFNIIFNGLFIKLTICSISSNNSILKTNYTINYCDTKEFCKNAAAKFHIACNNTGEYSNDCPENAKIIKLTDIDQKLIVDEHNKLRNITASGRLFGYKTAERMAKMLWSSELAEMAELNVKRCKFEHDDCRNIKKFPISGQNLGIWISYTDLLLESDEKNDTKIQKFFIKIINDWFNEYKDANMHFINKFVLGENPIGHFTVMVAEKNNYVGCAAIKFKITSLYRLIITCNYAYNNVLNYPIYKSGIIGSKCKSGLDKKYSALCNTNEIYKYNPFED